jgi:hypothetical protein
MSNDPDIARAQEELDRLFPSPERELNRLCDWAADLLDDPRAAGQRMLVLDIDDLFSQVRWHIGQAILLRIKYSNLVGKDRSKRGQFQQIGVPAKVPLLLRSLTVGTTDVISRDYTQTHKGMPVAGWVFHMMVDGALYRCVALLDRLARLLCEVTGVQKKRVYFRSGCLQEIARKCSCEASRRLVATADGEEFKLLLTYRDGYTHERLAASDVSGQRIVHDPGPSEGPEHVADYYWTPEGLLSLCKIGFGIAVDALTMALEVIHQSGRGSIEWM